MMYLPCRHDNNPISAQESNLPNDARDNRIPGEAYVDGSRLLTDDVRCQFQDASGRQCVFPSTRSFIVRGVYRCGHHWRAANALFPRRPRLKKTEKGKKASTDGESKAPSIHVDINHNSMRATVPPSADTKPITFKEYEDPQVQWRLNCTKKVLGEVQRKLAQNQAEGGTVKRLVERSAKWMAELVKDLNDFLPEEMSTRDKLVAITDYRRLFSERRVQQVWDLGWPSAERCIWEDRHQPRMLQRPQKRSDTVKRCGPNDTIAFVLCSCMRGRVSNPRSLLPWADQKRNQRFA